MRVTDTQIIIQYKIKDKPQEYLINRSELQTAEDLMTKVWTLAGKSWADRYIIREFIARVVTHQNLRSYKNAVERIKEGVRPPLPLLPAPDENGMYTVQQMTAYANAAMEGQRNACIAHARGGETPPPPNPEEKK